MTKNNMFPNDPLFNKEYRIRFEYYFDNRYCDKAPQKSKLDPMLEDFLLALGFTFDSGVRGIEAYTGFVDSVPRVMSYIHKQKERNTRKIDERESSLICALASSAFLFDFGYDDVYTYTQMEKEYIHLYKINMNKVRMYAKELYKILAQRFDEFLNLVPMTPIKWSIVEGRKNGKRKSRQGSEFSKDIWSKAFRDSERACQTEQHIQGQTTISTVSA